MRANFWMIFLVLIGLGPRVGFTEAGFAELELAQRYFYARKQGMTAAQHLALSQRLGELDSSLSSKTAFSRFATQGAAWKVAVWLRRAGGPDQNLRTAQPDLEFQYRVLERDLGPVSRWVISISSPSWRSGLSWEQMIVSARAGGSEYETRIRPCQQKSCESWRRLGQDESVATGGKLGPQGLQAPLFLFSEALRRIGPGSENAEWISVDFFGREQGWSWPKGLVWPQRLWNAQAEAKLMEVSR